MHAYVIVDSMMMEKTYYVLHVIIHASPAVFLLRTVILVHLLTIELDTLILVHVILDFMMMVSIVFVLLVTILAQIVVELQRTAHHALQ